MSEPTDDPYRETALVVRRPIAAAKKSDKARWLWWAVAAGGGAAAILLGAEIATALAGAALYGTIIDLARTTSLRRRHVKMLAGRPYPVTYDRTSPTEASAMTASAIQEVAVTLRQALAGPAAEHWATAATTAAPGLSVMTRDDTIVLAAWPWKTRDSFLLAHLLSTWGDALHAEVGITGVAVTWAKGGPPMTI